MLVFFACTPKSFKVNVEMKKIRKSKTESKIAEARKSAKVKISAVSQKIDV